MRSDGILEGRPSQCPSNDPIQGKCHTAIVYNILEYGMDPNRLNNITYGFA